MNRFLIAAFSFALGILARAQQPAAIPQEHTSQPSTAHESDPGLLARLTTPVTVEFLDGEKSKGTGFFYQIIADSTAGATGPHWVEVKSQYLITNRHVLKPEKIKSVKTLTFNLRQSVGDGSEWFPITIDQQELTKSRT